MVASLLSLLALAASVTLDARAEKRSGSAKAPPAAVEAATPASPGARPAALETAPPVASDPIGATDPIDLSEVAPPPPPPAERAAIADALALPLLDLFNVEQAPGQGALRLEVGDRKEECALGMASGYYGLGIVFSGKRLPPPAAQDLETHQLLQISFGSMRNRLQGQVPQFAAVTVALEALPNGKVTVGIEEPKAREKAGPSAYVLVTAPSTPNDRSDEEKLKGFFFGQGGKVTLTAQGGERVVDGKANGKRYSFRVRFYEVGLDAAIGTPFNAVTGRLGGSVIVPIYRPNGRPAQALLERIAAESFESSLSRTYSTDRERFEKASPRRPAGQKNRKP
jgi:hypothetical protein